MRSYRIARVESVWSSKSGNTSWSAICIAGLNYLPVFFKQIKEEKVLYGQNIDKFTVNFTAMMVW